MNNQSDTRKKRKFVLPLLIVIVSLLITGFAWAVKSVNILVDGQQINVHTLQNEPKEILRQAGISLNPQDEYYINGEKMVNGTVIEVLRGVPVTITYQGNTKTIITGKRTVGEVIAAEGIDPSRVKIIPSGDLRVISGMPIRVITVKEETVVSEDSVPSPVVRQPDETMERGMEEIVDAGTNGRKMVSTKMRYEDGKMISSEVLEEKVINEPKPRIVKTGVRETVQTSRGAMRFRSSMVMKASAYTPFDGSQTGITASGIPAHHGIAAVDPTVIPLGTRLFIPGYGLALAADTGGAIVGNRIDLCMDSYNEAMSFGRRTVKVYILE